MKISVKARPASKIEGVFKVSETEFIVKVKEPPREGRANVAIVKALAEYFKLPFYCVRLVSGATSKEKIFEIS
ncbi:MAG: DUF167 domain-containing protein [Patescibacteria group bacterium]